MIGKIIGGIAGFAARGPAGAVMGALLGHFAFDAPRASKKRRANPEGPVEDPERLPLFAEFASAACAKISRLKPHTSRAEIAELERVYMGMGLNAGAKGRAIGAFRTSKDAPYPFENIVAGFARSFHSPRERMNFMSVLLGFALSDAPLSDAEARLLKGAASMLRLDPSFIDAAASRASGSARHPGRMPSDALAEAYSVLGVKPGAPASEVKSVYRRKCKELHPDVLRSKGLGEFAMKAIEEELRKVTEAYELIMRAQ